MRFVQRLFRDVSGATMVEYGLIIALIAAVLVAALGAVGSGIGNTLNTASNALQ